MSRPGVWSYEDADNDRQKSFDMYECYCIDAIRDQRLTDKRCQIYSFHAVLTNSAEIAKAASVTWLHDADAFLIERTIPPRLMTDEAREGQFHFANSLCKHFDFFKKRSIDKKPFKLYARTMVFDPTAIQPTHIDIESVQTREELEQYFDDMLTLLNRAGIPTGTLSASDENDYEEIAEIWMDACRYNRKFDPNNIRNQMFIRERTLEEYSSKCCCSIDAIDRCEVIEQRSVIRDVLRSLCVIA